MKQKTIRIYVDKIPPDAKNCFLTYAETNAAVNRGENEICTTQLSFFSQTMHSFLGYDIFVYYGDENISLHNNIVSGYGKVRPSQNLYPMLMSGRFGLLKEIKNEGNIERI